MVKILLVDNGLPAAEALAGELKHCGHKVRCACHGIDALVVAEEFRPELAVLEMGRPRGNGCPTPRLLRSRPWTRRLVIIAHSRHEKLPGLVDVDCDYCVTGAIEVARLSQIYEEVQRLRRDAAVPAVAEPIAGAINMEETVQRIARLLDRELKIDEVRHPRGRSATRKTPRATLQRIRHWWSSTRTA